MLETASPESLWGDAGPTLGIPLRVQEGGGIPNSIFEKFRAKKSRYLLYVPT